MDSLSDLQLPTETVEVPGTGVKLVLRGLSVSDAAELIRKHGETLNHVYVSSGISGDGEVPPMQDMARALMQTAPLAVAEIIALSNGQPHMVAAAARLPFPVQVEALTKIAALTFYSEADLGKFLETVIMGSRTVTGLIHKLASPAT